MRRGAATESDTSDTVPIKPSRTVHIGSHWEPTNPHAGRFKNDDGTGLEVSENLIEVCEHKRGLVGRMAVIFAAQKDHGRQQCPRDGKQLPKVGVRRDHGPAFGARTVEDHPIGRPEEAKVSDMEGVVSRAAEQLAEAGREVFVAQEPHTLVRSGSSRSVTASAA